ncbi:hypothetical protein Tco_0062931, partial [Tanacetum coccineum]
MVAKALDIIKTNGLARGLFLNVDKTELFWPVEDPRSRVEGVLSINIFLPLNGIKLLGGLLLLLRNCAGVAKLSFALWTCSPLYLLEARDQFNEALRASLEKIVTASGPGFGDWQWRLATLPIKLSGLGILSARDIIHYAFLASRLQTSALQSKILLKTGIVSHGSSLMHAPDAFNTTCNVDVLSVTTCTSVPQMMKTLAKCYFGIIEKVLISKYSLSPRQVAYAVHCSSEVGVKFRHNLVRDILVDVCSKVGI